MRLAIQPKATALNVVIRRVTALCILLVGGTYRVNVPNQLPCCFQFDNHAVNHFCHRRLCNRFVGHMVNIRNGFFIGTHRVGRRKSPQQIKVQERTQCHSFRLYRFVDPGTEDILLPVNGIQDIIAIRNGIVISTPNGINNRFNGTRFIVILQSTFISGSHFRINLRHHVQKAHRFIPAVHVRPSHNRINPRQGILISALRGKQSLLLHLRFRVYIQPIIASRQCQCSNQPAIF